MDTDEEFSMMEMTYVVTFLLLLSFKMRNVYAVFICVEGQEF